jgi:hypothetical protein
LSAKRLWSVADRPRTGAFATVLAALVTGSARGSPASAGIVVD